MDSDDLRNRFKSRGRRDYLGPMPINQPEPVMAEEYDGYDEYYDPQQTIQQSEEQYYEDENYEYDNQYEYSYAVQDSEESYDQDYYEQIDNSQLQQEYQQEHPKRSKKKIIIISLVVITLIGLTVGGFLFWKSNSKNSKASDNQSAQVAPAVTEVEEAPVVSKKTVRFVATGDMIAHDAILKQGKTANGYDFSPMLANMKPYFDKADVKFCNQATPAGGESFGYTGYPIFNAPIEWSRAIEGVGCNVVNIGTNHTNDKGQGLIDATVAAWDNRQGVLAVVGANRNAEEQAKIRYFEKDGLKFAVLSYSTYSNTPITNGFGINMYDTVKATNEIAEANKNADIVIVSMRWGTEYSPNIDATQEKVSQELADAGADAVVGHGPHSLEPVKRLKGKDGNETVVWYSLGNFLNTQLEAESLIGGFAVMDIDTQSKKITEIKFMPVYSHYEWTSAEKAANNLLARKNITMYPLDQAAEQLPKSQLGTTVEAQTDRVNKLLNQFTPVSVIKSDQF
jgi:poly-gamma-glutamate capsule biosynthesis protein CapA/YwtB (metallophosphatase superfamily)